MIRRYIEHSNRSTGTSQEKAEDAVEHICFLADANRLYDHALGIYDLDVALLVAQQTQKACRFDVNILNKLLANHIRIPASIFHICEIFKKWQYYAGNSRSMMT